MEDVDVVENRHVYFSGGSSRPPPPPPRSPSLFLDQTEARREYLRVWMTAPTPPPLSKGLDDRGPPLSQGLDPTLHFVASNLSPLWNTTLPLLLGFAQTSLFFLLRELKQQRFWATDVNGKWTFYISEQWFGWNSRVNCLYKRKDT